MWKIVLSSEGLKLEKVRSIKNSIVMQKGVILENSVLENVVLDKDVKIGSNETLLGDVRFT